jgi:exodeoxyribonuclease-3
MRESPTTPTGRALPRKLGLLLDTFPLSPPLAERLESCGIDRDFRNGQKASDHAPLLAELRD